MKFLVEHSFWFQQWLYKAKKIDMLSSLNFPPLCASDFLELCQERVWGNLFNLYLISWCLKDSWGLDFLSSQWANECFVFFSFPLDQLEKKKKTTKNPNATRKKNQTKPLHLNSNTWLLIGRKGSQSNPLYYPQRKRTRDDAVQGHRNWPGKKWERGPRGFGRGGGRGQELCPNRGKKEREWHGLGVGGGRNAAWKPWGSRTASVARSPKWRDSHVSLKQERTAVLLPVNSIQIYCQRNICAHGNSPVMAAAAFLNRALFHQYESWTLHGWMAQAGREDSIQRQRCPHYLSYLCLA